MANFTQSSAFQDSRDYNVNLKQAYHKINCMTFACRSCLFMKLSEKRKHLYHKAETEMINGNIYKDMYLSSNLLFSPASACPLFYALDC